MDASTSDICTSTAQRPQQTAKLRDHFKAFDAVTAQSWGLYDETKAAADARLAWRWSSGSDRVQRGIFRDLAARI